MLPPECAICDVSFSAREGEWIPFAAEGSSANTGPGVTPPSGAWLCPAHRGIANDLRGASRDRASQVIASAKSAKQGAFEKDAKEVYNELVARAPAILATLGGTPGPLAETHARSWSPMDGALPPYCPFVDRWASRFRGASEQIEVMCELAHWSETERSQSSVSLYAKVGSTTIWVRGHAEGKDPLRELTLEAPAELRGELERLLGI